MHELLEIRVLGPFEVLAGGTLGGRRRLEASSAAGDARAPERPDGRGRRARRRPVGRGATGRAAERAPPPHRPPPRRARRAVDRRLDRRVRDSSARASTPCASRSCWRKRARAPRNGDVPAAADAVAAALALWRGPALQGLTGTAWFSAEARRLETLHVDALEEDFEVRLALGEHRELTPALRSALADNPFRERLWGQLMLALYRSGRQADALETFQEARRVLADELGLEPGPELRRLQEAILAHDPAIAAVPVESRRRGNLPAPATSFVGREDELARARVDASRAPPRDAHRRRPASARADSPSRPRGPATPNSPTASGSSTSRGPAAGTTPSGSSRTPSTFASPDPLARVTSRLRDAEALVVLDACEHVLDEAGRIASTLLADCPRRGSSPRAARRSTSRARRGSPSRRSRTRPSSSSSSARGRRDPDSSRTPRPLRSPARSPGASTGCRLRSSLPPRA